MTRSIRHKQLPWSSCLLIWLSLLLLSGCARPPWGIPVDEERRSLLIAGYERHLQQARRCGNEFDGEVVLHWRTRLDTVSLNGYYQIMSPSYLRLTVANPLGQPLVILAANGSSYQVLQTAKRMYYAGSLRSYGARNRIPAPFLSGPWFDWLTGRPISTAARIGDIRDDSGARGVWFSLVTDDDRAVVLEHILVEPTGGRLLERLVVNEHDEMQARVSYDNWQQVEQCFLPLHISITGLSFGAEAQIRFSEVRSAPLTLSDFTLPVPPGYLRQLMP